MPASYLILALLLICTPVWAENQFKIITLQHVFGETLVPALQLLAGPGGTVTASGNHLFVDVDTSHMLIIEQTVARLDVESQMFGIRVDRSGGHHITSSGADVSGRIGNEVRIERSGRRRSGSGMDVYVDSRTNSTLRSSSEYLNVWMAPRLLLQWVSPFHLPRFGPTICGVIRRCGRLCTIGIW